MRSRRVDQKRVSTVLGTRGEHLLTVDHPLVAVAHGAGLRSSNVGPGVGLRVAEAEADLAPEHPRDHLRFQLLIAPLDDRWEHPGCGAPRNPGGLARTEFVLEDRFLPSRQAGAPTLGWPPRNDPSALPQRTVEGDVMSRARSPFLLIDVVREVRIEEGAHVVPEGLRLVVDLKDGEFHDSAFRSAGGGNIGCAVQRIGNPIEFVERIAGNQGPTRRPPEIELLVRLDGEPDAPEGVYAHDRAVDGRLRGGQVGHRDEVTHRCRVAVRPPRRLPDQAAYRLHLGGHIGERVGDGLKRANRHPERHPVLGVCDRDAQSPIGHTDQGGRHENPPLPLRGHRLDC